jgi:hypothetical protein
MTPKEPAPEDVKPNLLDELEHALTRQLGVEIARLLAVGEYDLANRLTSLPVGLVYDFAEFGIGSVDFTPPPDANDDH